MSLFVNKLATLPLRQLFRSLNIEARPLEVVGKLCEVTIATEGNSIGQARYLREEDPILIKIRSLDGRPLVKGAQALILEHSAEKNIYLVEPFNLEPLQ